MERQNVAVTMRHYVKMCNGHGNEKIRKHLIRDDVSTVCGLFEIYIYDMTDSDAMMENNKYQMCQKCVPKL